MNQLQMKTALVWWVQSYRVELPEVHAYGHVSLMPMHPQTSSEKPWSAYCSMPDGFMDNWFATAEEALQAIDSFIHDNS